MTRSKRGAFANSDLLLCLSRTTPPVSFHGTTRVGLAQDGAGRHRAPEGAEAARARPPASRSRTSSTMLIEPGLTPMRIRLSPWHELHRRASRSKVPSSPPLRRHRPARAFADFVASCLASSDSLGRVCIPSTHEGRFDVKSAVRGHREGRQARSPVNSLLSLACSLDRLCGTEGKEAPAQWTPANIRPASVSARGPGSDDGSLARRAARRSSKPAV